MALLQGLELTDAITIPRFAVFGHSRQVIYKMIHGYPTGSINCRRLYDRVTPLLSSRVKFFHILRANNVLANALTNQGALLPQEHISMNDKDVVINPIP